MASFIVEGVGPGGSRTWILVEASNTTTARTAASTQLETGFAANIAVPADDDGIATLMADSPGFADRFPVAEFNTEQILSELGPGTGGGGGGDGSTIIPPVDDPATIPPTGTGGDVAALAPPAPDFANFLRGLDNRGLGGSGIRGQFLENQFDPLVSRFRATQALRPPAEGTDPTFFRDFVRDSPLAGREAGTNALDLFNQAISRSAGVDTNALLGGTAFAGSEFSDAERALLNPSGANEASQLSDLARAAARRRFGAAADFIPTGQRLSAEFFGQGAPTAQTFADFLNQRIFGGR